MATFQTLPGFREFYPEDFARRNHIFRLWRQTAGNFGFSEYDAPVLEPLDLYRAKSGDEIEGQLFSFTDKGGREVALRPEMTPTVCRLVGEKASTLKRPIKWFSIAEFYRYERMQKGRGRCFSQLNADIFGEAGVEAEIELISMLVQCFCAFGLTEQDFYVRLSDRDLWFYAMRQAGLDDAQIITLLACVDKFEKEGERAFETFLQNNPQGQTAVSFAKQLIKVKSLHDLLIFIEGFNVSKIESSGLRTRYQDWKKLLDGLEAMELSKFVRVDLSVVRGLAYYTGFVFEAYDLKGELRALAGGGRYNDLVKKLGGPDLPAVGFAIGDMTFALLLEQRGLTPNIVQAPDVYCVIDGEAGRLAAFPDIRELRASGHRVEYALKFQDIAFGKQFKAATESRAKLALIYGGAELAKGVVKLRDLTERSEREVPRTEVVAAVRDFLSGG